MELSGRVAEIDPIILANDYIIFFPITVEEINHINIEGIGNFFKSTQGRVDLVVFQLANIRLGNANFFSQLSNR
jgi:hypothetical protein